VLFEDPIERELESPAPPLDWLLAQPTTRLAATRIRTIDFNMCSSFCCDYSLSVYAVSNGYGVNRAPDGMPLILAGWPQMTANRHGSADNHGLSRSRGTAGADIIPSMPLFGTAPDAAAIPIMTPTDLWIVAPEPSILALAPLAFALWAGMKRKVFCPRAD
jgi:hypothetical protein